MKRSEFLKYQKMAADFICENGIVLTNKEKENLEVADFGLNDIKNIRVQKTSLLADVNGKFDIIVANILAEILLELIPQMDAHLNEGGQVIFSGIDYLQLPKIEKALDENGFKIDLTMKQGRWVGLAITRKEK